MSKEDTETKQEFVQKPKGTIKHDHCQLMAIDMESTELKNKSGWCVELDYKVKFQDKLEAKSKLFPGSKYSEGGLKVPANKKVLAGFKRLEEAPKKFEFTLIWEKGDEYWDLIDVQDGHVGRSGYQIDANASGGNSGGNSGGGNFSADAAAGQLINIGIAFLTANKEVPDNANEFFQALQDFVTGSAKAYSDLKDVAKAAIGVPVKTKSAKPEVSETESDDDTPDNDADLDGDGIEAEVPVPAKERGKAKDKLTRQRPAPSGDDFD